MTGLTPFKVRALRALADAETGMPPGHSPRSLALALWPNSPAWNRRTRGQRGSNRSGAMGGTMPMKGARVAWELRDMAYAHLVSGLGESPIFRISHQGRKHLEQIDAKQVHCTTCSGLLKQSNSGWMHADHQDWKTNPHDPTIG